MATPPLFQADTVSMTLNHLSEAERFALERHQRHQTAPGAGAGAGALTAGAVIPRTIPSDPLLTPEFPTFSEEVEIEAATEELLRQPIVIYVPKKPEPNNDAENGEAESSSDAVVVAAIGGPDDAYEVIRNAERAADRYLQEIRVSEWADGDTIADMRRDYIDSYQKEYRDETTKQRLRQQRATRERSQITATADNRFHRGIADQVNQQFLGRSYQNAARGVVERFPQRMQLRPSQATLRDWRRSLRESLSARTAAVADLHVQSLAARGIPVPAGAELDRFIARATRDTLRRTDDLLNTVYQAKRTPAGTRYAPKGRRSVEALLGDGHARMVARSLAQRVQDNVEQLVIDRGIKRGLISPIVRWQTDGSRNARHAALQGAQYRYANGITIQDSGTGRSVKVRHPRDRRLSAKDASLSQDYIEIQVIGDPSGLWR